MRKVLFSQPVITDQEERWRWTMRTFRDIANASHEFTKGSETTGDFNAVTVTKAFSLEGVMTPAQITGDQNNYAPTDATTSATLDEANVLRLDTDASRTVTGLTAPSSGSQMLLVLNVGSNALVLADESGSSTAANRFALNGDVTLQADEAVGIWYDETSSRWRSSSIAEVGQAQGDVLDDLNTLGTAASDGEIIVATGAGAFAYESGDTARTSLGVGSGDSPTFASPQVTTVEVGHATDTTLSRSGAGVLAVEGTDLVKSDDTKLAEQTDATWEAGTGTTASVVAPDAIAAAIAALGGGAWTFVSSTTISNDATIEFTGLGTDFMYMFVFSEVLPATDGVALWMRTSSDGGSTYDSGASDYQEGVAQAEFNLGTNMGNAANEGIKGGIVEVFNPSSATYTAARWTIGYTNASGVVIDDTDNGVRQSAADVDAVQFLFSSGNLSSGTIKLYKLAAS